MSWTRRALTLIGLIALVAGLSACGGDDASDEPIVFGEGEIPSTFPDDFPIPPGTVVGSTLIDRVRHRSEASLRVPADAPTTIQFFSVALVGEGYVVDSSSGSAAGWLIEFSRDDLDGLITVSGSTGSATLAVVTLVDRG